MIEDVQKPPAVIVEPESAPVRIITSEQLGTLAGQLSRLFDQYKSDRRITELRWMRNLRQYLGVYDPEIERNLDDNRSKAYPRITRVKCISVQSRIMNLMFPGNERNWELCASPSPEMSPQEIQQAMQEVMQKRQEQGLDPQPDEDEIEAAVEHMAEERAEELSELIDDQMQELGGDQTLDYIALNRKAIASGILYGLGIWRGPFVRETKRTVWGMGPDQQPVPQIVESYKPMFEFLPVWDFYPDLNAKTLNDMDGYFIRLVLTRSQLRKLADREDFFGHIIIDYLNKHTTGNYTAQPFEQELRVMGIKANVAEQKADSRKYEIIVWNGPISGDVLQMAGVEVPETQLADDIEAEVWMVDGVVIKADINAWRKLGMEVKTIHTFVFDEDDTSPIGNGLPYVVRDSQMSIAAATRMMLDNASVVCGPNLEVNTDLMRADQDLTSVAAYKIWYREGLGMDAQYPAVRNVEIDSHIDDLMKMIEMFMRFADMETFVGPATGGDMEKMPSEPMRTAAGASMLRGDAALPFKDIVRNFDSFTQSVLTSMVMFNRKFNPDKAKEGDYNVIARGATSLIAKEVRGVQVDMLASTLSPEERMHVDERKLVEQRFESRDMGNLLLPEDEVKRRQEAQAQQQKEQQDQQNEIIAAEVRKTLAEAFKNITQGQKNASASDVAMAKTAMDLLQQGLEDNGSADETGNAKD